MEWQAGFPRADAYLGIQMRAVVKDQASIGLDVMDIIWIGKQGPSLCMLSMASILGKERFIFGNGNQAKLDCKAPPAP